MPDRVQDLQAELADSEARRAELEAQARQAHNVR